MRYNTGHSPWTRVELFLGEIAGPLFLPLMWEVNQSNCNYDSFRPRFIKSSPPFFINRYMAVNARYELVMCRNMYSITARLKAIPPVLSHLVHHLSIMNRAPLALITWAPWACIPDLSLGTSTQANADAQMAALFSSVIVQCYIDTVWLCYFGAIWYIISGR